MTYVRLGEGDFGIGHGEHGAEGGDDTVEGEVEERVLVVLALKDLGHGLGRQVLGCFDHLFLWLLEKVGSGCLCLCWFVE